MTPAQRRRPFTPDGKCRVCAAWVGAEPRDRQQHLARHLRALSESRLIERDQKDNPHMRRPR